MRIAYLCSRYPALSHTFVMREVQALRSLGVEVETYSIRAPDPAELLSALDREEAARTTAILPTSAWRLLTAHTGAAARAPGAYLSTLRRALRLSPPGLRGSLWQLFYFAEAIILWRDCRAREITHIHVHFANVAADVALLATEFGRAAGGPGSWSFTLHGPTEFADVESHRLAEKAADATFVACISDFARSQLMGLLGPGEWEKLRLVRCGLIPAEAVDPPQRLEPDGPIEVLCVGRLESRKGHAVLIEAVALLARDGVDVVCTLAGDGDERGSLERLATDLGVAERVRFLGAVAADEVPALNDRADIFCLPSFAEGVPVVLMEAMSRGVPVVATRIMGVPELVEDGDSGLLVAPGRPDEIAVAIGRLAAEPDVRQLLGERGRQRVAEQFDLRESASILRSLFEGKTA